MFGLRVVVECEMPHIVTVGFPVDGDRHRCGLQNCGWSTISPDSAPPTSFAPVEDTFHVILLTEQGVVPPLVLS